MPSHTTQKGRGGQDKQPTQPRAAAVGAAQGQSRGNRSRTTKAGGIIDSFFQVGDFILQTESNGFTGAAESGQTD